MKGDLLPRLVNRVAENAAIRFKTFSLPLGFVNGVDEATCSDLGFIGRLADVGMQLEYVLAIHSVLKAETFVFYVKDKGAAMKVEDKIGNEFALPG